jgi:hypothetical protein
MGLAFVYTFIMATTSSKINHFQQCSWLFATIGSEMKKWYHSHANMIMIVLIRITQFLLSFTIFINGHMLLYFSFSSV